MAATVAGGFVRNGVPFDVKGASVHIEAGAVPVVSGPRSEAVGGDDAVATGGPISVDVCSGAACAWVGSGVAKTAATAGAVTIGTDGGATGTIVGAGAMICV
jgi:hypothetical protein